MVQLQIKKNTETLFLFESPAATPVADLIPSLVEIHNLKLKVARLADAAEELAEYGVMKPAAEHGLTDEQLAELADSSKDDNDAAPKPAKVLKSRDGREYLHNPDPTGRRVGEAPTEDLADIIRKTISEARECAANQDKIISAAMLNEAIDRVRGAVMIVYPMGLPEYDPVRAILEGTEDLTGTAHSKEVLDPATATLWWASKEMTRDKKISDFVGKNEKTKVIAKLQKKGSGAPVREPPVDEKTQKEMMAFYYRKQEEHKKLMENGDDDYLHSTWANPKSLKQAFVGTGDISLRPK